MPYILVTFQVLKLVTSKLINDWQEKNICTIDVTFDVSKLVTSRLVKLLHERNI